MRISDWSSDVCSSDLLARTEAFVADRQPARGQPAARRRQCRHVILQRHARIEAGARQAPVVVAQPAPEALPGRRPQACGGLRSAERRVGKEWVRTCTSRWWPSLKKKKNNNNISST